MSKSIQRIDWSSSSVIVLGLAKSGVAVAKLLHRLGADVIVNDRKTREECPEAGELEALGIKVITGEHPKGLIHSGIDLVVKNPGIPYRIQPIQDALKLQIPIVTEVEIASHFSKAPIIGITGSNGKTTTTTLVGKMLDAGNRNPRVAGNIGQALTDIVLDLTEDEWLIAELSSFQLKGTETFCPQIGALLNIVPAHLDYHQTMDDYFASKRHLFQNQTSEQLAVLNADSSACEEMGKQISSTIWWFSRLKEVPQGVWVKDDWIVFRQKDEEPIRILPTSEVALPGSFNLENALAATAIALACQCPIEAIQETLRNFTGVEHRLEYVETIDGVTYYNNSKATNAQAAEKSFEAFSNPVILIAGGLDRGVDFKELVPTFKEKVKALIAYGQSAPIFYDRAKDANISERHIVKDIDEAVIKASQLAESGDVVLLSPACASWDMYTSFEERGSIFKQAVHRLNNK
jgi:UDP-N-acetylmuramoylalanine--D-glutamate ligase